MFIFYALSSDSQVVLYGIGYRYHRGDRDHGLFADSPGAVRAVVLEEFDSRERGDIVRDISGGWDLVVGEAGVQKLSSPAIAS